MPRLDTATRNIVIGRLQAGESQNAVARLHNVHRNTISRLLQRYMYQQSGSTADRQRSRRPRITSAAQDRYIRVLHLRNRIMTARETASNVPGLRRVWFSEESRFMLQKRDGRTSVYRRRNERFARNCVLEVNNFGGGSVMMWGAISYARKTQLVHIPATLAPFDTEMRF